MGLLHWILNLAALLLWIYWRTQAVRTHPATRRGNAAWTSRLGWRFGRWSFVLLLLVALLMVRAGFYHLAIPRTGWDARLSFFQFHSANAFSLSLVFPWMKLETQLAFSVASFVGWLVPCGYCLVLLAAIKPNSADARNWNQFLASQLGWLHRLPAVILAVVMLALAGAAYYGLTFWFRRLEILPPQTTAEEATRLACGMALHNLRYVAWFAIAVLGLHVLANYIYFGGFAFWKNAEAAGSNLLRALRWLPLRWDRIDFTPLVGILLAYGLVLLLDPERLNRIYQFLLR